MINIVKIISSEEDSLKRRILKFLRLGKSDVQTAYEAMPYGVDSVPIKDLKAVYSKTGTNGETVLVGYINVNQIAKPGEHRIYATDENGNEQLFLYLKNDGTAEFGGNVDNMVRYIPLDVAMANLASFLNVEYGKIAAGIAAAGGTYTPGTANIDISGSKIDEIETL